MNAQNFSQLVATEIANVKAQIAADETLVKSLVGDEKKSERKVAQSRLSRRGYDLAILEGLNATAEGKFADVVSLIKRVGAFKENNGKRDWTQYENQLLADVVESLDMKTSDVIKNLAAVGLEPVASDKGKIIQANAELKASRKKAKTA